MNDDTALLIGGGIALAGLTYVLTRGGGGSAGATMRENVSLMGDGGSSGGPSTADIKRLIEQASGGSSSSTGSGSTSISPTPTDDGSMTLDALESINSGKFEQAVVERTGFLSSGFDAAGRVAQINRGNTVGL